MTSNDFEQRLHAMIIGAQNLHERNLLINVRNLYDAYAFNLRGASINDLIAFGNSNVSELERRLLAAEEEIRQLKSALYFAAGR